MKQVLTVVAPKSPPSFLPVPFHVPLSQDKLLEQAKDFWTIWQFPDCIAAVDGKHIRMIFPSKSSSLYFNHHEYFSTVLLAVVHANYKFVLVNVGSYGNEGDSRTFQKSEISNLLKISTFYPPPSNLTGSDIVTPYAVVGDEALRLTKHMMNPHTRNEARQDIKKMIFNYRLKSS